MLASLIPLAISFISKTNVPQTLVDLVMDDDEPENVREHVAKQIVNTAEAVFGTRDPESQAITTDAKIKFEKILADKQVAIVQATAEDRANARAAANHALSNGKNWYERAYIYHLATFWSFVATAFIFTILFADINEAQQRYVDIILGFLLGTIVASIIGFFFGNNLANDQKSQLDNIKEKLASPWHKNAKR